MNDLVGRQPVGASEGSDAGLAVHGDVTATHVRVARDVLPEESSVNICGTWVDDDPERRPIGLGRDQKPVFGLQSGDRDAIGSTPTAHAVLGGLWTVDPRESRLRPTTGNRGRSMSGDRDDQQDSAEAKDSREDYVAPTLTDLGSFQELTQLGVAGVVDVEGSS
jgi:hypothetical protein